jgi:hypothetical protein
VIRPAAYGSAWTTTSVPAGSAATSNRCVAAPDQPLEGRLELGEVAARVVVDEADRRPGEDVVELLQEQELPEPIELGA